MSAAPESAANPELPLNSTTLAAAAVLRLKESTPEPTWEAMSRHTRSDWLQLAGLPHGFSATSWRGLPPECQRKLRITIRWILVFLASAGADLIA